uniref:ACT domain-containing protein n=1 Tax=Lacticaseibacillus rhamnosus TaxID=47715 RepID=UPI003F652A2E
QHYLVVTIRQYQLALHLDIIQHALDVIADHHLVVDYLPTGIDSFSLLIREPRHQVSVHELTAAIKAACQPDKLEVTENVALIAMVSRKLRQRPAIAGKVLAYLDDNLLNVQLVSQTNDDINLLIGVNDKDYDKAIRVIYSSIHQNFHRPAPYIEGIA